MIKKNENLHHIFEQDKKLSIENLLAGPTKITWQNGLDNKLGWLVNKFKNIKGTNTIAFIHRAEVPKKKKSLMPTWAVTIDQ